MAYSIKYKIQHKNFGTAAKVNGEYYITDHCHNDPMYSLKIHNYCQVTSSEWAPATEIEVLELFGELPGDNTYITTN